METIKVNKKALIQVLRALTGAPHLIRELQVTRDNLPILVGNPIDILLKDIEGEQNGNT